MIRKVFIGLLAAAALGLGALGAEEKAGESPDEWHLAAWPLRKVLEVRAGPAAWILTVMAPHSAAGGADLRVVGPKGQEVRFDIVYRYPDGRWLILFETAAGAGRYYLYSGRQFAAAPPKWEPRVGLLLEVRRRAPGECGTWEQMKKMVADSKEVQGVGFRPSIFDGYNPFGPSDDYVSIYRGWLNCPETGEYGFSTMSDEASFVFIDGKPVCQWAGRHTAHAGRNNQFNGTVRLTKGVHLIEYYHVEYDGDQAAVAAWRPPGEPYFAPIPPGAFVQPTPARLLRTERRQGIAADFDWSEAAYLEVGPAAMTAVQFRFMGSSTEAEVRSCLWEFGDGTSAQGLNVRHIYTAMGNYTVRATALDADRRRASIQCPVTVAPKWDDLDFTLKKIELFAGQVREYPFDKMTVQPLLGAFYLMREAERKDDLLKVCQALYPQRDNLPPAERYEFLVTFGDLSLPSPDDAIRLYQMALELVRNDKARQFAVETKIADAYHYYKRDLKTALALYKEQRDKYRGVDPVLYHTVLIRIGDVDREMGEADEARKAYAEAEKDGAWLPKEPKYIRVGAWASTVEELLKRGEAREALDQLDKWEWAYPTARLEGYNLILRARANLILGNFPEARKQAEIYLKHSADPNYVPEALLAAAEAAKSLADVKAAREYLDRIIKDFPESPSAKSAKGLLKTLN